MMLSGAAPGPGDHAAAVSLHGPSPQSPPAFPLKSAFSPLVPPGVFNAATVGRYPFLQHQQHAKRFLNAPYSGTGFLSSIIQSANACSEAAAAATDNNGNSNATADRCGSGGDSQE